MIRKVLEVLDFLLAIKHLPAFNAEDLTIRFLFDRLQSADEAMPLGRVAFDHGYLVNSIRGSANFAVESRK